MTDPRPPAGTDLAPCPWCGRTVEALAIERPQGLLWNLQCSACAYAVHGALNVVPHTLATAPWTRALWAEVERLRGDLDEAHLTLAAEQGRQEGAPSSGWAWNGDCWSRVSGTELIASAWTVQRAQNSAAWHLGRAPDAPQSAPNLRAAMKAADEAEAAAAKEPTP